MNYYLKESSKICLLKYLKCTKITIFIVISLKSGKKKYLKAKKSTKKHIKSSWSKKSTKMHMCFLKALCTNTAFLQHFRSASEHVSKFSHSANMRQRTAAGSEIYRRVRKNKRLPKGTKKETSVQVPEQIMIITQCTMATATAITQMQNFNTQSRNRPHPDVETGRIQMSKQAASRCSIYLRHHYPQLQTERPNFIRAKKSQRPNCAWTKRNLSCESTARRPTRN